jgi:hypothetical protein
MRDQQRTGRSVVLWRAIQGGRFQTMVWPKVTDSLPVARLVGLSGGKGLPSGKAGFVHGIFR